MNAQERNAYFTANMTRASAKTASKPELVRALAQWADCGAQVAQHRSFAR